MQIVEKVSHFFIFHYNTMKIRSETLCCRWIFIDIIYFYRKFQNMYILNMISDVRNYHIAQAMGQPDHVMLVIAITVQYSKINNSNRFLVPDRPSSFF